MINSELKSESATKYYFSGEFDGNQTDFEYKSNQLLICVKATTKVVGLVLLWLLHIIIDEHPNLLWYDLNDITEDYDLLTIGALSEKEEMYLETYEMKQSLTRKLIEHTIYRKSEEVNMWTLERIRNDIMNIYK